MRAKGSRDVGRLSSDIYNEMLTRWSFLILGILIVFSAQRWHRSLRSCLVDRSVFHNLQFLINRHWILGGHDWFKTQIPMSFWTWGIRQLRWCCLRKFTRPRNVTFGRSTMATARALRQLPYHFMASSLFFPGYHQDHSPPNTFSITFLMRVTRRYFDSVHSANEMMDRVPPGTC